MNLQDRKITRASEFHDASMAAKNKAQVIEIFCIRAGQHGWFSDSPEGLHVAQPYGDYLPYDLIIDSGQEVHRVQIKTVTMPESDKPNKFGFNLKSGLEGHPYRDDSPDFFGLIILPLRTIYIVPQHKLSGKVEAYAYPKDPNSAGALERYRENWELL